MKPKSFLIGYQALRRSGRLNDKGSRRLPLLLWCAVLGLVLKAMLGGAAPKSELDRALNIVHEQVILLLVLVTALCVALLT